MPLAAPHRKLKQLEAQMAQHIDACHETALRQLTDDELEQLSAMFRAHPELEQLDVLRMRTMARPATLTPAQWAVLQHFATLFFQTYREKGEPHAHATATHPTP